MAAGASKGCPCIDTSAILSSLSRPSCQTPTNETGVQLVAEGACYPFSHGSSKCLQHDLLNDPACRVAGVKLIPPYCFRPWCFVDPDVCKRDSDERVYRSSFFPFDSGVDLYYSYSTCNSTAEDWLDEVNGKALNGISIKASIPKYQNPIMFKRDSVTGEPLEEVGSEYYDNNIPYEGIFPDYIKKIVEISDGDIKNVSYTYRSRASSLVHPTSSYTATVQDIEDGLIQMGVAPFWVTGQRMQMVSFTIPMLYDKTFLVVSTSTESLLDQIVKVLEPFTYDLWIILILIIVTSAVLSVWFSDRFTERRRRTGGRNQKQYRNLSAYARLALDSFLQKGIFFCSAGVEQEEGSSLPNKVLMFGFAFFILIAVSAYVANLAAFLTRSLGTSVNTMEAAVKEGLVICAHPVVEVELKVAWPTANFYFHDGGREVLGMIEDYEAEKCDVLAIGWEDNTMDMGLRERLCDNKLFFTDSLILETPSAFPINPALASGFSFWMYQAEKYHDISIKKMNEEYLNQVNKAISCPLMLSEQSDEGNDYTRITIKNFFFPLVLYLTCAIIAIILQLVHQHYSKSGNGQTLLGRESQLNLVVDDPINDPLSSLLHRTQRKHKRPDNKPDSMDEDDGRLPQNQNDDVEQPDVVFGCSALEVDGQWDLEMDDLSDSSDLEMDDLSDSSAPPNLASTQAIEKMQLVEELCAEELVNSHINGSQECKVDHGDTKGGANGV